MYVYVCGLVKVRNCFNRNLEPQEYRNKYLIVVTENMLLLCLIIQETRRKQRTEVNPVYVCIPSPIDVCGHDCLV